MLNTLSLIFVLILSLFLPFYCVDFNKDTILSIVNVEENSNGEQVETIEHASTEKRVEYVEELAQNSEENATVEPVVKEAVLESSKNHDLDDLEKLILDELNNVKKD